MKILKPGYRTTEFWISVILSGISWIASAIDPSSVSPKYALLIQGLSNGVYILSRGLAKSAIGTVVPLPNQESRQGVNQGSEIKKVGLDPPSKAY